MNRQNVAKWCREFEAGRSVVHDEGYSLSLMKSSKKSMKTFVLTDVQPSMNFINDDEVQDAVMTWLRQQAEDFHDARKKISFPGSLNALRSMVTMLKGN
jgi:hypothetical protein